MTINLAARGIEFRDVVTRWVGAGSKDTPGILQAFEGLVERWTEESVTAADIDAFRFIGAMPTDRWPKITGGTYRLGEAVDETDGTFEWRPEWSLITVPDPENGECVILDGNNRALSASAGRRGRTRPTRYADYGHHWRSVPAISFRREGGRALVPIVSPPKDLLGS